MKRYALISGGLVGIGIGGYYFQKPVDETHLCNIVGNGITVNPIIKILNRVSALSEFSPTIKFSNLVKRENLEKEAQLLTQPWSPSPFTQKTVSEVVNEHLFLVDRYITAFNHKEACFSPLGKLIEYHIMSEAQKNRFVPLNPNSHEFKKLILFLEGIKSSIMFMNIQKFLKANLLIRIIDY